MPVKSAYAKYRGKQKYTGLIVSAPGLGAKPAMFPQVLDGPSGLQVFGPNHVGKKYAIEKGVVGYAPSVQKAMGHERVGKNPLVVKAIKVEGLNKAKLVVSRGRRVENLRRRQDRRIPAKMRGGDRDQLAGCPRATRRPGMGGFFITPPTPRSEKLWWRSAPRSGWP